MNISECLGVSVRSDIYKETYRLYYYKDDFFRLVYFNKREKGWEDSLLNYKEPVTDGYNWYDLSEYKWDYDIFSSSFKRDYSAEINRISISRTKRRIKEILLCNDFKYFVTLTINSEKADRYSLEDSQAKLKQLIKNYSMRCSRRGIKFHYLLITEKHKDGAFHFHRCFF